MKVMTESVTCIRRRSCGQIEIGKLYGFAKITSLKKTGNIIISADDHVTLTEMYTVGSVTMLVTDSQMTICLFIIINRSNFNAK